MTGNLLVTPEKLISASQEFSTQATAVQTITQQMLQIITELGSTWAGEANTAYSGKFKSLEDDMTKIYKMITEHSKDLQEMARNYSDAEKRNVESTSGLKIDMV